MKADSPLKVASNRKRKVMREKLVVTPPPIPQVAEVIAVADPAHDQDHVRVHVQSIEVDAEEDLEVDLGPEAGVIVKTANWIRLIAKMLVVRPNIEIFKRNERRKRREMNMKVLNSLQIVIKLFDKKNYNN